MPGFLSFRSYCQAKNYYVFANSSLKWIVLGFLFALVLIFLCRSRNIRISISWRNQFWKFSTPIMILRRRKKGSTICWKSVTILCIIHLRLCQHIFCLRSSIGSHLWLGAMAHALKYLGNTQIGPPITDSHLNYISAFSWACISLPCSNLLYWRETTGNTMNGCSITLCLPAWYSFRWCVTK